MVTSQLWWYTARASGIVAWALLAASVVWGLALSTRALGPRPRPAWLLDLHRFLGAAGVVFTAIHVGSLVADSYVHFGPAEVLVPLASRWHPVAVAWGVVSVYLVLAVEVTSLLRRHLSRRAWRLTHLLSFPLFTTATIHLLSAGTDRQNPALRVVVLLVVAVVAVLTVARITARRRPARSAPAPGAADVPAAAAAPAAVAAPVPAATSAMSAGVRYSESTSNRATSNGRKGGAHHAPVAWPTGPPVARPAGSLVAWPAGSPTAEPLHGTRTRTLQGSGRDERGRPS